MLLSTLMQQQLLLSLTDRPHKLMSHWHGTKEELSAFFFYYYLFAPQLSLITCLRYIHY